MGFLGGPVIKNLPANSGDAGSIPGQYIYIYIHTYIHICRYMYMCFPSGTSSKELTAKAGDGRDRNSIPRLERYPGGRNGNPL